MVSATLTIVGSVIAYKLTESLSNKAQSWAIVGPWMAAGIIVTYLLSRVQARSTRKWKSSTNSSKRRMVARRAVQAP